MKEISIARIFLAFIGLFLIGTSLLVTSDRCPKAARTQQEQDDLKFEDYTFVMPDGALVNTRDLDKIIACVEPYSYYD